MAVMKALGEIEGLENINVNLATGKATFEETIPVDMDIIRERIRKAGYEVV